MNPSPIVSALVNYTRVLQEAQSPRAALWQSQFIDQCVEWCLYIETELAILSEPQRVSHMKEAQDQLDKDYQLALPPVSLLLNALHHFYISLIGNKNVSHDLYRYLLSTYQFLDGSNTARENLTKVKQTNKKNGRDVAFDSSGLILYSNFFYA